jgi:hypothetical protein
MAYKLTKGEIRKELLKCGRNPNYFINNYVKIAHPIKGLVPFKLYNFQEDVVKDFEDYRFNIVLKARQLGLSTTTAAYITWLLLFHRNKNVVIMATKLATAANLVKKVKLAMKSLPEWMKISKMVINNRNSFELANGSQVKAISTSGDAGRSEALSLLVLDEAAIIENMEHLWAGLYPTLSTGGNCIILSTPNGVGNLFHKLYTEAEEGANDFNPVKLLWDRHPERDQAWLEKETRNMSPREIAQELMCSFNTSGATLLSGTDLQLIGENIKEPKYKTGFDRNLWIWETYDEAQKYLLIADVARGDGEDFSAVQIMNINNMEQVAEYQGKLPLDLFARFIYDTSKEYGHCLTVVENNSIGISVLEKLKDLGHPNLYYSKKSSHEYVENAYDEMDGVIPGFSNTTKTRPLIIAKLEEFIRNKAISINSLRIYNEFKTFVWNNGKAEAMRSYHDDLVMAMAIACWVRDTALIINKKEIQYKKALLGSLRTTRSTLNTSLSGMKRQEQRVINLRAEKKINLPFFIG